MRLLTISLLVLLSLLQIRLWRGNGSIPQVTALQSEIDLQQEKIDKLKERNQTLEAEVKDLKNRFGALEEHARTDLGMCRQGETFYQYSVANADAKKG